eukprot:996302-Alexandrium_andersonii.AAC.1
MYLTMCPMRITSSECWRAAKRQVTPRLIGRTPCPHRRRPSGLVTCGIIPLPTHSRRKCASISSIGRPTISTPKRSGTSAKPMRPLA